MLSLCGLSCALVPISAVSVTQCARVEQLHLIYKIFQLDSEYKGYSICEDKTTALNNIEKKMVKIPFNSSSLTERDKGLTNVANVCIPTYPIFDLGEPFIWN